MELGSWTWEKSEAVVAKAPTGPPLIRLDRAMIKSTKCVRCCRVTFEVVLSCWLLFRGHVNFVVYSAPKKIETSFEIAKLDYSTATAEHKRTQIGDGYKCPGSSYAILGCCVKLPHLGDLDHLDATCWYDMLCSRIYGVHIQHRKYIDCADDEATHRARRSVGHGDRMHTQSYARSQHHTQLAKMSFHEIFDLTGGVYFNFCNIASVLYALSELDGGRESNLPAVCKVLLYTAPKYRDTIPAG